MQIILLERIEKLGQMGDLVNVKPGYARNYLLPQGKALRANKANIERFETERAQREAVRKPFNRRRKACPFSGPNAPKIDYKDSKLLLRFTSERGKIIPSRISAVSAKKQRELAIAIKRARFLALMPYVTE